MSETVAYARKALLSEPLIFGDDRQIRLLRIDALASELANSADAKCSCDKCEGEGVVECPECSGTGDIDCAECDGDGNCTPSPDAIAKMTLEDLVSALGSQS